MAYPPPQQGPPPGMGGAPYPGGAAGAAPTRWQPGGAPQQWEDVPGAPLADQPGALAPGPPPPMTTEGFQTFDGYGQVGGFGQTSPMPPPPPPPPPSGAGPDMNFDQVANLSEQQCREAMLGFVAENCCYGKSPAQDHSITAIQPSSALHYILETFGEVRETGYQHEPYRGQPVVGPECGPPPPPWAIPCSPDRGFDTHTKLLEVPNTAIIKPCHACRGRGFDRCWRCHGLGRLRCDSCGGDGRRLQTDAEGNSHHVSCGSCGGDGRKHCYTCGGDGRITCRLCDGFRFLKCFIQLTVRFVNHKEDHIMEKTDMPDELVRDVGGILIFEQVLPQVWPIIAYPVQEINANSMRLVAKHSTSFPSERRLNQRQQLRAVAVTEVAYSWKDVKTRYWVYGKERKVHSPDYPQQCCWGCTIL